MGLRLEGGVIVDTDIPPTRVSFYTHPKKVGIGKWEDTPYIKFTAPGVKDVFSRLATEDDKLEWSAEWAAYERGRTSIKREPR